MRKITDQKLKNKRFKRSEESIVSTFLTVANRVSLSRFVRLAHISRSTLHRHHGSINEILPNYEAYLLNKWKNTVNYLSRIKHVHLRFFYERLLLFLISYRRIVQLFIQNNRRDLIEKMVAILKPKITSSGRVPDGEPLDLYIGEVAILVEEWCKNGFKKDSIPITLEKIIQLTNTAHTHFGPLVQIDHRQNDML